MDTATFVLITGFVSSIGAIGLAILTNLQSVKKSQLEALSQIIDELREQVERQKVEINELRAENAELRAQLRALGHDPDTRPRKAK